MSEPRAPSAIDQALAQLGDPEPEVRVRAVRRLRVIGGPQAVVAILGALDDPDDKVWGRAALALGELEAREVVPALIENLRNDPTDKTRAICAFALAVMGDSRALRPLIDALNDRADEVVWYACHGLGQLHDPMAIEPLLRLLDHPTRSVRAGASSALVLLEVTDGRVLATLDDLAKGPEGQLDSPNAAFWREALIRRQEAAADENEAPLDEENAKPLTLDRAMRGLRDPDPLIRDRAIGRLRGLEGPEAVAALVSALDDPVVKVRSSAALALGAASALEALPALVEHMLSTTAAFPS